jgi:hypothetical protein
MTTSNFKFVRALELAGEVLQFYPCNSYFQNFEESLIEMPDKHRVWAFYGRKLAVLAEGDWTILKKKVVPRFRAPDTERHWQTAIDLLNESFAYDYLLKKGCKAVELVPETNCRKTPDVCATYKSSRVVCEVKTKNRSDKSLEDHFHGRSFVIEDKISSELMAIFEKTICASISKFENEVGSFKIFFFVLNCDDTLHEYSDCYFEQIKIWLNEKSLPIDGLVFLDNSTMWRAEPLILEWPPNFWQQIG